MQVRGTLASLDRLSPSSPACLPAMPPSLTNLGLAIRRAVPDLTPSSSSLLSSVLSKRKPRPEGASASDRLSDAPLTRNAIHLTVTALAGLAQSDPRGRGGVGPDPLSANLR